MRQSRPRPSRTGGAADETAAVLDGTEIRIAYKIGYVLNFYREPAFRRIETAHGITRPEIVTLIS